MGAFEQSVPVPVPVVCHPSESQGSVHRPVNKLATLTALCIGRARACPPRIWPVPDGTHPLRPRHLPICIQALLESRHPRQDGKRRSMSCLGQSPAQHACCGIIQGEISVGPQLLRGKHVSAAAGIRASQVVPGSRWSAFRHGSVVTTLGRTKSPA